MVSDWVSWYFSFVLVDLRFCIYSRTNDAKGEKVASAHPIDGAFRYVEVLRSRR